MANIHFVHIDYRDYFDDQNETTRKIVFSLLNRAIQITRNSFIYINEFEFDNYLDDLSSEISNAIRANVSEEDYNNYYISSLSMEELEYQFKEVEKEYIHILNKL